MRHFITRPSKIVLLISKKNQNYIPKHQKTLNNFFSLIYIVYQNNRTVKQYYKSNTTITY